METQESARTVTPIRVRISELLGQLQQTPGWLAERAGVERSTVKRILDGDRNPTADTLATLAPILGVTIEQLVHDTDAANRIDGARKLIERSHYEDAVRQYVAMEQRANELSRRISEAEDEVAREEKRRRQAEKSLENAREDLKAAQHTALHHQLDAQRYQDALNRALTELADLSTKAEGLKKEVEKLGGQVGDNTALTGLAAFCAAIAAAASLNNYLKDDPKPSNVTGARKKKRRAHTV